MKRNFCFIVPLFDQKLTDTFFRFLCSIVCMHCNITLILFHYICKIHPAFCSIFVVSVRLNTGFSVIYCIRICAIQIQICTQHHRRCRSSFKIITQKYNMFNFFFSQHVLLLSFIICDMRFIQFKLISSCLFLQIF